MSTWYLWIKAMQEPFDGGVDEQGRAVVVFNVMARKRPSDTFLRELVHVVSGAVNAKFGTGLLATSKAALPPAGDVVVIVPTGGGPPVLTQGQDGSSYEQPTAMFHVHAEGGYENADRKARAAKAALIVVKNRNVTAA